MRSVLLVAVLLALPLLPVASASGASLALEGPQAPIQAQGATRVPVRVHVALDDAICGSEADLHVRLAAYGPSTAQVEAPEEVVVHVPAGGYVAQPFVADAETAITILADPGTQGHVMVVAGYDVPASCMTSGDASAKAQLDLSFSTMAADATPPPSPSKAAPPPASDPAPAMPPRPGSLGLVALLLGGGLVGAVFFVLGRLGQRGQVGGRDELP